MADGDPELHDDDDADDLPCYRHPSRMTALRCTECERPICWECAVQGPVGIKCPDHARAPRSARAVVPTQRMARGIVAGLVVAVVLGSLLAIAPIPFLGLILGIVVGIATVEVTRRASGGYRDPMLTRAAAACAVIGIMALPVAWVLMGEVSAQYLVFRALAAGFAVYGAMSRG